MGSFMKSGFHFSGLYFPRLLPLCLCFFLLSAPAINSQDFEINTKLQLYAYNTYDINKSEYKFHYPIIPFPLSINAGLSYYPSKQNGFELITGLMLWPSGITGYEYGIATKFFLTEKFYVIGTYLIHFTEGGGGHTRPMLYVTFYMPGIGTGYRISKRVAFELIYLDPGNTPYERYHVFEGTNYVELTWMIKANVVFNWRL